MILHFKYITFTACWYSGTSVRNLVFNKPGYQKILSFTKSISMKSNILHSLNVRFSVYRTRWIFLLFSLFSSIFGLAQVSINTDGTTPHASAMLEVKSSNRGFLLPRLNMTNRPASPTAGLVIYQTDFSTGIYFFDGSSWQKMSLAAFDFWNSNGLNDIYFNTGRVGIGTTTADNNGLSVTNYISGRGAVKGSNQYTNLVFAEGYLGVLQPAPLGLPTANDPYNIGVLGVKPSMGGNGAAIYGWNNDVNNVSNFAGMFYADGANTSSGNNYGVYSVSRNAKMNYAGYFNADGAYAQGTNYGVYAIAKNASQNYAGIFKGRVTVDGNNGSASGNDTLNNVFTSTVRHTRFYDTRAILATSTPQPGYGIAIQGVGAYMGVYGTALATTYTGWAYGVYGEASGSTAGTRIGVYGVATGGTANWGSYFVGSNYMSGDLRIGTTTAATGYALSINGKIACTEVLVQDMASWPDYVFKSNYNLMSLDNLEQSIKENGHLPGLPSAQEIETKGLHLGNMQKQVVEKVEELTLYTIEQGKMLKELKREIDALKAENALLKKAIK